MRLGVFAKTFPGSTPEAVMTAARAAGFEAVQYNMACSGLDPMPDAIARDLADAVAQAAERSGLVVAAVSATWNMIHPDPAVRDAGQRRLGVLAGVAARMGTRTLTLCTGTRDAQDQWRAHPYNASPEAWRDLLDEMGKAVAVAEAQGLRLGIEPELANVVDSAAKTRLLIDTLQSEALVVVLDPANLAERAETAERRDIVARAVDLLGDRIVMAHAKDRAVDGGFVAAGQGVIDFPHFVGCLRGAGFAGDLVTHGLTAAEAPGVARFLRGVLG